MTLYKLKKNTGSLICRSINEYKKMFTKIHNIKELNKKWINFYVVKRGKTPGIYTSLKDCKKKIKNLDNGEYKEFNNYKDAFKYYKNKGILNVYTDGSCLNHGKPNCSSGIGIYFSNKNYSNISEFIPGKHSNNFVELLAIKKTLSILKIIIVQLIFILILYMLKDVQLHMEINKIIRWSKNS